MDIKRLQELAGIEAKKRVIVESHDDDEDPDAKIAAADKRQREFERKHARELSAAEKEASEKEASEKEARQKIHADTKKEAPKAAPKKEAPKKEAPKAAPAKEAPAKEAPAKEAPAKEEPKAAGSKGRKSSDRGSACREWLNNHPDATRGQFIAHCATLGMTTAHANTSFYSLKKKKATNESWMIFHPSAPSFVLAENPYSHRYQWVGLSETSGFDPLVFDTFADANKIVETFGTFGFTPGSIKKVFEDGEVLL